MEPMILGIPAGAFVVLSVVVPTWLVYLGFESHILHLRNRWAYWVVGISLMVFAVLVRGDLAEFANLLLGALMASAPLLFGRGTLARRVTLSVFGLVIVLPGDLFLDMTFDILAGATIGDHAKVAANATLFACATLFEVFVEITLFWGLTALVRRFYPEKGWMWPRRRRAERRSSPHRSRCSPWCRPCCWRCASAWRWGRATGIRCCCDCSACSCCCASVWTPCYCLRWAGFAARCATMPAPPI